MARAPSLLLLLGLAALAALLVLAALAGSRRREGFGTASEEEACNAAREVVTAYKDTCGGDQNRAGWPEYLLPTRQGLVGFKDLRADSITQSMGSKPALHDHAFDVGGANTAALAALRGPRAFPVEDPRCAFISKTLGDKNASSLIPFNEHMLLTHPDPAKRDGHCYLPPHVASVSYDAKGCSVENHHLYDASWADVVDTAGDYGSGDAVRMALYRPEGGGEDDRLPTDPDATGYTAMCQVRFRQDVSKERLRDYVQFLYAAHPEREYVREATAWIFNSNVKAARLIGDLQLDNVGLNKKLTDTNAALAKSEADEETARGQAAQYDLIGKGASNYFKRMLQDPDAYFVEFGGSYAPSGPDFIREPGLKLASSAAAFKYPGEGADQEWLSPAPHIALLSDGYSNISDRWLRYGPASEATERAGKFRQFVDSMAAFDAVFDGQVAANSNVAVDRCRSRLNLFPKAECVAGDMGAEDWPDVCEAATGAASTKQCPRYARLFDRAANLNLNPVAQYAEQLEATFGAEPEMHRSQTETTPNADALFDAHMVAARGFSNYNRASGDSTACLVGPAAGSRGFGGCQDALAATACASVPGPTEGAVVVLRKGVTVPSSLRAVQDGAGFKLAVNARGNPADKIVCEELDGEMVCRLATDSSGGDRYEINDKCTNPTQNSRQCISAELAAALSRNGDNNYAGLAAGLYRSADVAGAPARVTLADGGLYRYGANGNTLSAETCPLPAAPGTFCDQATTELQGGKCYGKASAFCDQDTTELQGGKCYGIVPAVNCESSSEFVTVNDDGTAGLAAGYPGDFCKTGDTAWNNQTNQCEVNAANFVRIGTQQCPPASAFCDNGTTAIRDDGKCYGKVPATVVNCSTSNDFVTVNGGTATLKDGYPLAFCDDASTRFDEQTGKCKVKLDKYVLIANQTQCPLASTYCDNASTKPVDGMCRVDLDKYALKASQTATACGTANGTDRYLALTGTGTGTKCDLKTGYPEAFCPPGTFWKTSACENPLGSLTAAITSNDTVSGVKYYHIYAAKKDPPHDLIPGFVVKYSTGIWFASGVGGYQGYIRNGAKQNMTALKQGDTFLAFNGVELVVTSMMLASAMCGAGTSYNNTNNTCVPTSGGGTAVTVDPAYGAVLAITPATGTPPNACTISNAAALCKTGTAWDATAKQCRLNAESCDLGTKLNDAGTKCVPAQPAQAGASAATCARSTMWDATAAKCTSLQPYAVVNGKVTLSKDSTDVYIAQLIDRDSAGRDLVPAFLYGDRTFGIKVKLASYLDSDLANDFIASPTSAVGRLLNVSTGDEIFFFKGTTRASYIVASMLKATDTCGAGTQFSTVQYKCVSTASAPTVFKFLEVKATPYIIDRAEAMVSATFESPPIATDVNFALYWDNGVIFSEGKIAVQTSSSVIFTVGKTFGGTLYPSGLVKVRRTMGSETIDSASVNIPDVVYPNFVAPVVSEGFRDVAAIFTNHAVDPNNTYSHLYVVEQSWLSAHPNSTFPSGPYSYYMTKNNDSSTFRVSWSTVGDMTDAYKPRGLVAVIYFLFADNNSSRFQAFYYTNLGSLEAKVLFYRNATILILVAPGHMALLYSTSRYNSVSPPKIAIFGDSMRGTEAGSYVSVRINGGGTGGASDYVKIVDMKHPNLYLTPTDKDWIKKQYPDRQELWNA